MLVDAVRTHPYAVVLLDEIEKAHADIYNILLQVMDHATLTDNGGRKADFRHAVLILTSNAGSREASAGAIGFGDDAAGARAGGCRRPSSASSAPSSGTGSDAIVTFGELSPAVMETIVEKFILQLETQLAERRVAIHARSRGARVARREGPRPQVRSAAARAGWCRPRSGTTLTDEILFGRLERGGTVRIGLADDALTFDIEPVSPTGAPEDKPPPASRRKRRASEPAGPA